MAMPGADFRPDDGPYTECEVCGSLIRGDEDTYICDACWDDMQRAEEEEGE